jgi:signal transduction histidine kinase
LLTVLGLVIAVAMFWHVKGHLEQHRRQWRGAKVKLKGDKRTGEASGAEGDSHAEVSCAPEWQRVWAEKWAEKFQYKLEREQRRWERHAKRAERRWGVRLTPHVQAAAAAATAAAASVSDATTETQALYRANKRAKEEIGFYVHLMTYLGVIALLALINLMTTRYPWFLWPAFGWGIGVFSHYMATFGRQLLHQRYFEPAIEREVRREKVVMQTEKQASIDELSSTIAHEIRNPIAAAKSLVQQMGEDPTSVENVEYAKVALDELDRVERRISHLLRFAKEEDYQFDHVNLASVVDSALTQLRAKLDAAKVNVARNYIAGPTINADKEKLQQVFANVLDNAIDALEPVAEGRRIDLFIENGGKRAVVRMRDNGCGIPPEKVNRIFNPFFTTKEKGTGLGMAISRKIVEAHEGSIDVVSEPGRGTEFAIALPLPQ